MSAAGKALVWSKVRAENYQQPFATVTHEAARAARPTLPAAPFFLVLRAGHVVRSTVHHESSDVELQRHITVQSLKHSLIM